MDSEKRPGLARLHTRTREAADALQTQAADILEMAEELERLTEDTPAWYAATWARVGARATPEQAEELRSVLG